MPAATVPAVGIYSSIRRELLAKCAWAVPKQWAECCKSCSFPNRQAFHWMQLPYTYLLQVPRYLISS